LVFFDLLHLNGVEPAGTVPERGNAGKISRRLAGAIRYAEHLIDDGNASSGSPASWD
jgi:hypothetical protein